MFTPTTDALRKEVSSRAGIYASAGRNDTDPEKKAEARAAAGLELKAAKIMFGVAKAIGDDPISQEQAEAIYTLVHSRVDQDMDEILS